MPPVEVMPSCTMKILCYTDANRIHLRKGISWLLQISYIPNLTLLGSLLTMWGVARRGFEPTVPGCMWIRCLSNENNRRTSPSITRQAPCNCLGSRSSKWSGAFYLAEVDRKKGGRLTSPSTMLMRAATAPSYIVYYSLETAGSAPCHAQVANSTRGGLIGALFIHRQPLILIEHLPPAEIVVEHSASILSDPGADRHKGPCRSALVSVAKDLLHTRHSLTEFTQYPRRVDSVNSQNLNHKGEQP